MGMTDMVECEYMIYGSVWRYRANISHQSGRMELTHNYRDTQEHIYSSLKI